MKKSIKELFAALEGEKEQKKPEAADEETDREKQEGPSPAERVGRALLERLGAGTDADEEELADAIIAVWADSRMQGAAPEPDEPEAEAVRPQAEPPLIASHRRMRAPMRTEAAAESPMDYAELSPEQFRRLKKQLQKAAADGRRVRI